MRLRRNRTDDGSCHVMPAVRRGSLAARMGLMVMLSLSTVLSGLPGLIEARAQENAQAVEESEAEQPDESSETAASQTADGEEVSWNENYYRAADNSGSLSEAERNSLDEECIAFMRQHHLDIALLAITSDRYAGSTLEETARSYYDEAGFGYGEEKSGFQMIMDTDTNEILIVPIGGAEGVVPDNYLAWAAEHSAKYRDEYGVFGPMYATVRYLARYMENRESGEGQENAEASAESAAEVSETETEKEIESAADAGGETASGTTVDQSEADQLPAGADPAARVGEGADMPAWYPVYPKAFPEYHDAAAPRVVDTADLFTDEEESVMEARLSEIREELQKDIVIFTDVSTYGLERKVYAADFYDFNGYGIGDDYEGVILFICMDPNDRGWWACCTGPETMSLYSEELANQLDDMLYEYMIAGSYYAGVSDWIENIRRVYKSGSPYTPEWAMQSKDSFERFHDTNAPRIVDDAHLLTEEEINSLTEKAADISAQYGLDVVVYTALNQGNMEKQEFSDLFYRLNGYGLGDDYDGILLTVFKRPGYRASACISAFGKGAEKLSNVNRSRLIDRCENVMYDHEYRLAISSWMDQTEHMLRTGRVPRTSAYWLIVIFFALILGCIFGGVSLYRAMAAMETPRIAESATRYLVPGSLKVRRLSDRFLHSTTTRVYSPRQKDSDRSSGSSSSHRSSYSGSYKGSSGRTHSGSGRNF